MPATELCLVLLGLRGRPGAPVVGSLDWTDQVAWRLRHELQAWSESLAWPTIVQGARHEGHCTANLLVLVLLGELTGRPPDHVSAVRDAVAAVPPQSPFADRFGLTLCADLLGVQRAPSSRPPRISHLVTDPGEFWRRPSAFYDLTHAVFLESRMGQRSLVLPEHVRRRALALGRTGVEVRTAAGDLDLACELAWTVRQLSPSTDDGHAAALAAAVDRSLREHGCVTDALGRHRPVLTFSRTYHPTLTALLAFG